MTKISILGAGWLGLPLGRSLAASGHTVAASTTSQGKFPDLEQAGLHPFLIDLLDPQTDLPAAFLDCEVVIITVPPSPFYKGGRSSTTPPDGRYAAALSRVAAQAGDIRGLIYTSSTSAYGHSPGQVDESTPPQPVTTSAQMVVQTEKTLRDTVGDRLTVLRLGGLIGGQRDAAKYFAGRTGASDPHAPVNLVHRSDVIGVVEAILAQDAWGQIFNVVAPEHPTREEHYTARTRKLGLEPPTFTSEGQMGKWVRSDRVQRELGYRFEHVEPRDFPVGE